MDDNPLALALGGALVALLAGFGIYRFTKRGKTDSGETSFLESRLQPDSLFGASGGQRIDTRDAGGASSSMSYSLSQLDAIGDVDPVAEADVYLAYGRDLQAEEILKEAMRSNPDRMAIRTKLLEVYAKRRDTKGFELLATQLYSLTRGQGEDWAKAQELGLKIDPDHALYQPGGVPVVPVSTTGEVIEPLGATTMPQSTVPSPSQFSRAPLRDASPPPDEDSGIDLDLDLGDPDSGMPSAPAPLTTLPPAPPPPSVLRPAAATVEYDLSGVSLEMAPTSPGGLNPSTLPPNSGLMDLGLPPIGDGGGDDPFARKLQLAEEFRQIGDLDGARDLLQEVVAKSSGALQAKAQGMLDELG